MPSSGAVRPSGPISVCLSTLNFCPILRAFHFLLTRHSHFWQKAIARRWINGHKMRRDGTTFVPRVRVPPKAFRPPRRASWSWRRGRGLQERPKKWKKTKYEKWENNIYDGLVCACLLCGLPTSAKRHRHTRSRFSLPEQHGRWATRPCWPNQWDLQFSLWFLLTPE